MDASAYNMSFDKEQLSVLCANYDRRIDALAEENAKLRELVRDIADHIKHDDGFGIDRGWMLDRMRELGVEVSE